MMHAPILTFADELGPQKILQLYHPGSNLRAVLVIDNTAIGPAIGGVRMAADVTIEEAARLARAMTLKNAAAGLPHGGGKAVIQADPKKLSTSDKENLIRIFAVAIKELSEYIPGPDMGTDEICMAWIKDEIDRAVGLPREMGGIPLDEIGATGFGLVAAAKTCAKFYRFSLKNSTVAIQGFGAVGRHAAKFFQNSGAKIVSVADSKGTVTDLKGLDVKKLLEIKAQGGSISDYEQADHSSSNSIVKTPCDIWIPAARPDVIHSDNVLEVQARLIIQGANIPITDEAEEVLFQKGIHVVPDFIANAGGVICAAVEHRGGNEQEALNTIEQKISANAEEVISKSSEDGIAPRKVAKLLAELRIKKMMSLRRGF